jgi:hypothetical protein
MKSLIRSSMALGLLLIAYGVCNAAEVLKQEPPIGSAASGEKFLVDDGSCGRGKINEVTIGQWSYHMDASMTPQRQRRCTARR